MRIWGTALALLLGACASVGDAPVAEAPLVGKPLTAENQAQMKSAGAEILFWAQAQRFERFRAMETLFPGHRVTAGGNVRTLPAGAPLAIGDAEVDAYMQANNVAGLIVLQDGKVRLERYAFGYGPEGRWTSFSVAKSFTSTLVGAAVRDGSIKSLSDPVTRYIPELAGSGYDGVTVEQLLTMTSGVRWNEDYTDPNSDVAKMYAAEVPPGVDPTVAYMRTLPRATPPGEKWVYKTGETNLIGVLVTRVTGKSLAAYLSEKVWRPYGMEQDAFWMIDGTMQDLGGCCMSVSLRDYARMGQFALEGGKGVVPDNWFANATAAKAQTGRPGFGYGYQWWTYPQGRYGAQGIFGQAITVDPAKRIVIAQSAAWPKATGPELGAARLAFFGRLIAAAD
ncbi:class A beta-lactamase-related serine hydrolase [Sphingomonas gilva]|uniref:Class A beta-lactamase-related serine hydrolase n=1 Tax=Sphingomonas gilva TaxID=2305907 RepID=A0A396RMM5_9SPHN|nr:serine hydrolase domain-containing protein [Sphingomonas gilva]RHW16926.1 class A beta-lactamase-related serine hydrolase [Sphingomonas gilva]